MGMRSVLAHISDDRLSDAEFQEWLAKADTEALKAAIYDSVLQAMESVKEAK